MLSRNGLQSNDIEKINWCDISETTSGISERIGNWFG